MEKWTTTNNSMLHHVSFVLFSIPYQCTIDVVVPIKWACKRTNIFNFNVKSLLECFLQAIVFNEKFDKTNSEFRFRRTSLNFYWQFETQVEFCFILDVLLFSQTTQSSIFWSVLSVTEFCLINSKLVISLPESQICMMFGKIQLLIDLELEVVKLEWELGYWKFLNQPWVLKKEILALNWSFFN